MNLHETTNITIPCKSETQERDYLFDNIKAILIFSVVIAHYFRASDAFSAPTFGGVIYIIAFSYIMQGFLFISGYFSKNPDKCRSTAFRSFLFPYLLLMPIMFSIRYLIFGRAHFDLTLPTMALWYLLTLFVYRYFLKDLVRMKSILPISIAVSLASGYFPVLDSTLSLGRTFSFLPFFLLGYYFKMEWIIEIRNFPKVLSLLLLTGLTSLAVLMAFHGNLPLEALHMKGAYGLTGLNNLQGLGLRILISLVSMAWVLVFISLAPKSRTILTVVGQNTMTVYIMHIIVRYVVKLYGGFLGQDLLSYLIMIGAAVYSVWVFSKPGVTEAYNRFVDRIYQWVVTTPLVLVRQIL